ncbi:hypothetical protein EUTSA_v10009724mg [Eutrema salsugineum]|uniref:Uncharacterized protein n=1 Tax=Eutrema salsugineum TaxID=72664 RepID=V4L3W1_EUTSA|nr:uncharacterized protein LOC18992626 [Eutrema salsugineum]ESQ34458.1 hypothetical protein EUTSA_v10009724mg [Eutrema salsugineum]
MSKFGFLSGKDDLAVENLLSQAKDLYVLEQVAAINCSGFTDSVLPTNLETRFRRLKSLPVSRPDPVSSSKRALSHSRSMTERNHENAFSASGDEKRSFSGVTKRVPSVKTRRPLVSSVEETRIFSGIKRDPSLNSGFEKNPRGGLMGSSSSRFSREGKILSTPTTQSLKLLPKEKSRMSSSSFVSIDLASSSSDSVLEQEERSNRKSKTKSKLSWFDKFSPSRAMGCLCRSPGKSSSNSKKTMKSSSSSSSKFV